MKKVALGCAIALVVGILGLLLAYLAFLFFVIRPAEKVPPQLQTSSVLKNVAGIRKSFFFSNSDLGTISWMGAGSFRPHQPYEICVAGSDGAAFLGSRFISPVSGSIGVENRFVKFPELAKFVDVIDVDGDGTCEYLIRTWKGSAVLLDHDGGMLWKYGSDGVDDVASGDIDSDGVLDFVVGFNGFDGIDLLKRDGRRIWHQNDGNVWHVEMVDIDEDGNPEILHSSSGSLLTVRDKRGKIVRQFRPAVRATHFSLSPWPKHNDKPDIVACRDQKIFLLDFQGTSKAQLDAPFCNSLGEARATPVRLGKKQLHHFAVLVEFHMWGRSILYIYDSSQRLIYEESFDTAGGAVAALQVHQGMPEQLFVGTDGEVLVYDF